MKIPTAYKLGRMKKEELVSIASQLNCQIEPNAKRPEILEAVKAKIQAGVEPAPAPQVQERKAGNKKLFEELTTPDTDTEKTEQGSDRGGARVGAGRKPGKTLEQSKLDALPVEPNRTVEYVIKYLFKFWAGAVGCPEIALDDDELKEFAVDTTQMLEYHGLTLPQGLHIDGKFLIGGCELFGSRIIMHKIHKNTKKVDSQEVENANKH